MTIDIATKQYHPIHRQNGYSSSQPRFKSVSPSQFFTSLYRFTNQSIQDEPPYGDVERAKWLSTVWRLEPYLAGVINSVVSIDKNRGWTLTGGRNQVKRFVDILHNRYFFSADLSGWRTSFGGAALSYYTTDLGSITEVGRAVDLTPMQQQVIMYLENGYGAKDLARIFGLTDNEVFALIQSIDDAYEAAKQSPLDSLYFVDPTRCTLTGSFEAPLKYKPSGAYKEQLWTRDDYFRVVSMPSIDDSLYGLGLCAVSRCIELAKIMVGIYQYDNEMLLNRAPRGLLLLKGMTQEQWNDAMVARRAKLDGDRKEYYGEVNVIAALDPGIELEAQLVSLSQLPSEFDQKTFTDLLMYGYALCFGYDPREFWPVSAGALGTATETEAQHRKAGAKGGLDFVLGSTEKLQEELPETIQFEFEERDMDGEMANATVQQAQADVIMAMYDKGGGIITAEQARVLAAQQNLIDPDWTLDEEETVATDTDEDIARSEAVQRAIYQYPDEPIVRYTYNGKHAYRTIEVPAPKKSFIKPEIKSVTRQVDEELELYQEQINALSIEAVNGDIEQDEYQEKLDAFTLAILTVSLLSGLDGDSESSQILTEMAELVLIDDSQANIEAALDILTDRQLLEDAIPADVLEQYDEDVFFSLDSTLADDVYAGQYEEDDTALLSRLGMWGLTALGLHTLGTITAKPDQNFMWVLGATEKHCETCSGFSGQVKTGREWKATGYRPQARNLACNGYNCDCSLPEVN